MCPAESPWTEKKSLMTIGDLRANHDAYIEAGSKKADASGFKNVVNKPLIIGPDDSLVINSVGVPELHCMTGLSGKLMNHAETIIDDAGQDGAKFVNHFLKNENIKKSEQRGGCYEGNQAKKLLDKCENLITYVGVQDEEVLEKIYNLVDVMKKFALVRDSCFGIKLNPAYQYRIEEFCSKYRQLPGITFPIKFHLVEQHIKEFLELHGDGTQGLGCWSEQSMETCHSDFKKFWSQVGYEQLVYFITSDWSVVI